MAERLSFEVFTTDDGRDTCIGWSLRDSQNHIVLARSRGAKLERNGRYIGPPFELETNAMEAFFRDPLVRGRLIHHLAAQGM